MHDPMVVAHTIRRPWPQVRRRPNRTGRRVAVRFSWRRWYDFRSAVFMTHWHVLGLELYWPSLVTIWHVEPGGRDSLTVCKHSGRWRWHVHHWRFQLPPLQALRRWLLTRCSWCGGRSRKGDVVNVSHQWDGPRGRWWRGEPGLFHADCSSIERAHRTCTCTLTEGGPWASHLAPTPYGRCATCGLFRPWQSDERRRSPQTATTRILKEIPKGQRDKARSGLVSAMWTAYREEARDD
jgi:hypothetical protein